MNVIIESEKDREEREKQYSSSYYRTTTKVDTKTPEFGSVDVVLQDMPKQTKSEQIDITTSSK